MKYTVAMYQKLGMPNQRRGRSVVEANSIGEARIIAKKRFPDWEIQDIVSEQELSLSNLKIDLQALSEKIDTAKTYKELKSVPTPGFKEKYETVRIKR